MTEPKQSRRPDFEAFVVEGDGDDAYWTKIGGAWSHENGEGLTVRLTALPLSGKLVLRKPKAKAAKEGTGQ